MAVADYAVLDELRADLRASLPPWINTNCTVGDAFSGAWNRAEHEYYRHAGWWVQYRPEDTRAMAVAIVGAMRASGWFEDMLMLGVGFVRLPGRAELCIVAHASGVAAIEEIALEPPQENSATGAAPP